MKTNGGTSISKNKRSVTAAIVITVGALMALASAFGYVVWYKSTMDDAVKDLRVQQDEIIRYIQSGLGTQEKINRLEKNTMVKVEDLVMKSYAGLYRDLCEEKSSKNYQMVRFLALEVFDRLSFSPLM